MNRNPPPAHRSWLRKFAEAFAALAIGIRGQSSFYIHLAVATAVIAAAIFFQVDAVRWSLLILSIALVLAAEMMNRALEILSRAVTQEENPYLRDALNVASASVLITALGAVAVGTVIFIPELMAWLWPEQP